MRQFSWLTAGVVAFLVGTSSASAQETNFTVRDFSPKNVSNALTGVKPGENRFHPIDGSKVASGATAAAGNVGKTPFSLGSLFPRLSLNSVNKGYKGSQNTFNGVPLSGPIMPVMSTVSAPNTAGTFTGSPNRSR